MAPLSHPLDAALAADPLAQVERAQALVERSPVAFVAALFALAFMGMLYLYLRSKDRHEATLARLQKEHAVLVADIHRTNDGELAKLNSERLKMAIQQTTLFTRVLGALDSVEELGAWMRSRKQGSKHRRRVVGAVAALPEASEERDDGPD